jgi:hypothetical protein
MVSRGPQINWDDYQPSPIECTVQRPDSTAPQHISPRRLCTFVDLHATPTARNDGSDTTSAGATSCVGVRLTQLPLNHAMAAPIRGPHGHPNTSPPRGSRLVTVAMEVLVEEVVRARQSPSDDLCAHIGFVCLQRSLRSPGSSDGNVAGRSPAAWPRAGTRDVCGCSDVVHLRRLSADTVGDRRRVRRRRRRSGSRCPSSWNWLHPREVGGRAGCRVGAWTRAARAS